MFPFVGMVVNDIVCVSHRSDMNHQVQYIVGLALSALGRLVFAGVQDQGCSLALVFNISGVH